MATPIGQSGKCRFTSRKNSNGPIIQWRNGANTTTRRCVRPLGFSPRLRLAHPGSIVQPSNCATMPREAPPNCCRRFSGDALFFDGDIRAKPESINIQPLNAFSHCANKNVLAKATGLSFKLRVVFTVDFSKISPKVDICLPISSFLRSFAVI